MDYKVDEKKLYEVFKLAGKVLHVELGKDKDGKSRGFGVIEYDHPVESVQAISMLHNQQLYDRRMTVRLDRANEPDMPPKLPEGNNNNERLSFFKDIFLTHRSISCRIEGSGYGTWSWR